MLTEKQLREIRACWDTTTREWDVDDGPQARHDIPLLLEEIERLRAIVREVASVQAEDLSEGDWTPRLRDLADMAADALQP